MKKACFLIAILFTVTLSSQIRRNNNNNGYPDTRSRGVNVPEFKPAELAGLVKYDIKKTCKKISVKQKSDLGKKVASALAKYNKSVKDIKRINKFSLDELKTAYKAAYKKVQETRDVSVMNPVRKNIRVVLDPIRKQASKKDSILTADLKALLNKKQLKKWIKYSNNIKKKARPKVNRQPVRTMNPNRRRGY
jgi:hypothetical protein